MKKYLEMWSSMNSPMEIAGCGFRYAIVSPMNGQPVRPGGRLMNFFELFLHFSRTATRPRKRKGRRRKRIGSSVTPFMEGACREEEEELKTGARDFPYKGQPSYQSRAQSQGEIPTVSQSQLYVRMCGVMGGGLNITPPSKNEILIGRLRS